MKKKVFFLSLSLSIFFNGCKITDKDILNKTVNKLNSIDKIEYTASWVLQDMNFSIFDTVRCYFDFTSKDTLFGAKYHFLSNRSEEVFNGNTEFLIFKNQGFILYSDQPTKSILNSSHVMINSVYSIKKLLPGLLKDTSVHMERQSDTLIDGENNYRFKLSFKNPYNLGELFRMPRFISDCILVISHNNYLPTQFICKFAEEKGTLKAEFTNLNLNASRSDSIWDLKTSPEEYPRMTYNEWDESRKNIISGQVGEKAPDWKLPLMAGDSVKLSDLNKNLVLLEFWFPYCSGCVESIPALNNIQDTYSKKGLTIYGVEYTRFNGKGVAEYIDKHKIKYPILYSGRLVANWYSVHLAPTFFLINKKGTIVYTSKGFNKNELLKAIENNI